MTPGEARLMADIEQLSASMRDDLQPVPVPAMDLWMLVQFAFVGAMSLSRHCAEMDKANELPDLIEAEAFAFARVVRNTRQPGATDAADAAHFAAVALTIIRDRYPSYFVGRREPETHGGGA